MDKCPKCGRYTLEFSHQMGGMIECYNMDCRYTAPKKADEWYSEHNNLPNLAKSLELRRGEQ